MHARYAIAAARCGKHVLVEKPMATSAAECDEMIAAAHASGVKLMVGHSRRYFPMVRRAKEIIDASEIGPVTMLRQSFCHDARKLVSGAGNWKADPQLSVGFFLGYGCHQRDMTLWLLNTQAERVVARFGAPWSAGKVETCGSMLIDFANGAHTTLWEMCSMPDELSAWPPFPEMQESNEIVGEKGLMLLNPYQKLMVRTNGQWRTVMEMSAREADPFLSFLREEVEDLVESINTNTAPPVTAEEGRHVVAVCQATYESSRTGAMIQVNGR